jgi:hypothetical protein
MKRTRKKHNAGFKAKVALKFESLGILAEAKSPLDAGEHLQRARYYLPVLLRLCIRVQLRVAVLYLFFFPVGQLAAA